MVVRSVYGVGTSDGTRETERGTSMDEMRPRGKWSDSELNQVKFLHASNSTSQIAKIFKTTKNANTPVLKIYDCKNNSHENIFMRR